MCLAIPGRVVEIVDRDDQLVQVDVTGVRRTVNVGLLDVAELDSLLGSWVLIHVGFALSEIDEREAQATLALLREMGDDYAQELAQLRASAAG
ncbi:MAG TPA: HypC/HybG/HupF family hydrogenase formation chaperone [Solirubrobacteraceae bacterium]|nr:HypC/HybG/HupF family hydrogenase formation chaperone [Solirubrobacteraceae bacterium]